MFNKNAYRNVIAFPTGKPFVSTEYVALQQNIKNLNDYLAQVEQMVKDFNWKKPTLKKTYIKNRKDDNKQED